MGFKRIINSIIIILTTFVISILFIEIYASINPQKFPSYGWQGNNIMSDRIDDCKNKSSKKIIGLFGDSGIEYFLDTQSNVASHLQKKLSNYTVCNFGISGHSITTYTKRFLYSLDKNIFFNSAIFYFFEGNDFSEFKYTKDNQSFSSFALVGPRTIEEIDSTLPCLDVDLSDDQIAWLNLQT